MTKKEKLNLRDFKYKGFDKSRFRIVKLSNKKFRVDFKRKFLFFEWWDKNLEEYSYFISFEDGHGTNFCELIFENLKDAKKYINIASRKLIKFKQPKEEIIKI